MTTHLTPEIGQELVAVARHGLEVYVRDGKYYYPDLDRLPTAVNELGCSFVTLTSNGRLRGCIGNTQNRWPLAEDVARHAGAASRDPRFAPVKPAELSDIRLEVTILTPARPLTFTDYEDLLQKLRPGTDGVILSWRERRAVLLPQVWDRIPKPEQFLAVLARKAGIPERELTAVPPTVGVLTFQVQHFAEPGYQEPGN
ncbi:MAG: AmmeMemoRadiSam system protein A [Ardenticatenaceae bacterium]|nr:AmmeMemoRadiSam system protein A [Ardenticatenaceae bacterium]